MGLGAAAAARFVEVPAGNFVLMGAPQGVPQREAKGLRPRPDL